MRAPPATSQLVFVELIGFRSAGTRVLRERIETTANGTRLLVHAAAAAPDRTDVVVEWERAGDPAECPPDSQLLVHSNMKPLERGLTAELVTDTHSVKAITMRRRRMHSSYRYIGAIDMVTFPPLGNSDTAELRVSEGPQEWRLSIGFAPGGVDATALEEELTSGGVVLRATAVVPFVELNDREPSVTADLRGVPVDVDLGGHRFRIMSAQTSGADQRRVVMEVAPSASRPRFTQPMRMHGNDEKTFAWNPEL